MALAYLLSPTFEITNSAGKPATGGYIEVYVAGTRNKYYCASDFDGTLHPFRIPLDSLGANIVLAEDTGTYDVYVYNRYGGQMMSRYNVKAGGGGSVGIGSITSSDGSISVTPTSTGVDLRVDLESPSILRATAQSMTGDGLFQFSELQRDGQGAAVDVNGKIILSEGWWHYDATARLNWPGTPGVSGTQSVSIYTANGSDSMDFDLSYAHSETVQLSGEYKSASDGTQFILGMSGIPAGLTVELVDFGIHSIVGGSTSDGVYYAGNGIQIDETTRVISVDTDTVQEKLTAGQGITIENNVISTSGSFTQVQADWTENDPDDPAYIKHRPDLSQYATDQELTAGLSTKQDTISDLSTIRAGAAAGATAVQPGSLATVATTGDYDDLSNKPTIPVVPAMKELVAGSNVTITEGANNVTISATAAPQLQSNWNETNSSSVQFIQNKPTIPVLPTMKPLVAGSNITITENANDVTIAASGSTQVQANWNETDNTDPSYIQNKPSIPVIGTVTL